MSPENVIPTPSCWVTWTVSVPTLTARHVLKNETSRKGRQEKERMLSIEPRRPLLRALSHKRVDFSWKQGLYAFYFKIGRRREICLTCCPMSFYLQCLQNYRESKLTVFLLFRGFFFKPFFTRYLGNGIFAMSLNILNIVSTGNAFLAIPGNKCLNSEIAR